MAEGGDAGRLPSHHNGPYLSALPLSTNQRKQFQQKIFEHQTTQNTTTRSGTSSSRPLALALGEADVGLREVSIAVHNIIWKILQLSSSSNPALSLLSGLPFIGHCAPGNFSLIKNNPKEFSIGFMQLEKQHVSTLCIYGPTVTQSTK